MLSRKRATLLAKSLLTSHWSSIMSNWNRSTCVENGYKPHHSITTTASVIEYDDNNKRRIIQELIDSRKNDEESFYVCDLGEVVKKWDLFQKHLPRVEPFYALKCNPDPLVVAMLANLGAKFDCASGKEIETILDVGLSPEKIIFANPCKQVHFIEYAREQNVNMMTFDNESELHKIKKHHPDAELVIRIKVDDSGSLYQLGIKFGVPPRKCRSVLQLAKELDLNVIGVSFHCGSCCFKASSYYDAVQSAKHVFDEAREVGFKPWLLNVGGGYPGGPSHVSFEEIAQQLNRGFDDFFANTNVRIIAEPGRFFVEAAFTSVNQVFSLREDKDVSDNIKQMVYYIGDGVYGSFSANLIGERPIPYALNVSSKTQCYDSVIFGPTCDSIDCVVPSKGLPKLQLGDWICFDNMGAYSVTLATSFNGFGKPRTKYVCPSQFLESNLD